jgi:hypothetical protein
VEPIIPVSIALTNALLDISSKSWKKQAQYTTLKALACERLGRELYWNAEILFKADTGHHDKASESIRTEAFDDLVRGEIPLDIILDDSIEGIELPLNCLIKPRAIEVAKSCNTLSLLIDRVYHRLWMIKQFPGPEISDFRSTDFFDLLQFTAIFLTLMRCGTKPNGNLITEGFKLLAENFRITL